jgi:hypothetical protein
MKPAWVARVLSHDLLFYRARATHCERRERTKFGKDKRRKHRHWLATIFYRDGERFARTYTDHEKADRFAERQRKSSVVKLVRVTEIS